MSQDIPGITHSPVPPNLPPPKLENFISSDYLFPAKVYAINKALREGRLLTAMVGAFYLLAELRHQQRTVHQENGTIDKYKEGQTFRVQSNIQASI